MLCNYAGVIYTNSPCHFADLLGYLYQITRTSQQYKWPSWVIFDQNFCLQLVEQGSTELAHLDPPHCMHSTYFSGQTKEGNPWCQHCHSMEHSSDTCPLKPPPTKHPKTLPPDQAPPQTRPSPVYQVHRNFNKKGCKYGKKCRCIHQCLECGGPHLLTHCPMAPSNKADGPTHPTS